MGLAADDRWLSADCSGVGQCLGNCLRIVSINRLRMPAISVKSLQYIFREAQLSRAVDGDAVVVIEQDQLAQTQVAGQ